MRLILSLLLMLYFADSALSEIRIATYNMYAGAGNYNPDNLDEKIRTLVNIGEYPYNGIVRPFDILVAQELMSNHSTEKYIINGQGTVNGLNYYYGNNVYSYDSGYVGGDGYNYNGVIYNTQTVSLIERVNFRASGAPRDTVRYRFRIIGYGPESDIYVYNSHFKAYDDQASRTTRATEAQIVRWSKAYGGDSLPEGSNIIYAGDYNLTGGGIEDCTISNGDLSAQGGYDNPWFYLVKQQYFTGTGAAYTNTGFGQAIDLSGMASPVNWNNNSAYRRLHTYGSANPASRLDFQLVSNELYDGEGVSFIGPGIGNCIATESSYRPLGNDGTHTYGDQIKKSSSHRYDSSVFNDLALAGDHLPVIADYQRPAVLSVEIDKIPEVIHACDLVELRIIVRNDAAVTTAVGADELDYNVKIISGGTCIGENSGSVYALSDGNSHIVQLDSSSIGEHSLSLLVSSDSQGCANSTYTFTTQYSVIGTTIECSLYDLAYSWLSGPDDDNWNEKCDIYIPRDNVINLLDFIEFSQHWP